MSLSLWAVAGAALVWWFALIAHARSVELLDSVGTRAYSFYLVHQPIILLCAPIAFVLPGPPLAVLAYGGLACLLVACATAELLYRTVERPSHRSAVRRFPQPVDRVRDSEKKSSDGS